MGVSFRREKEAHVRSGRQSQIDPKQTLLRKRCYAAAVGTRRPLPGAAAHRAAADSQADRRASDGKGATSPRLGARRGDDDPGHSTQTDVSVHAQRLGNPHEICLPCLLHLCGKIVQKLRQTERTRPGD